MFATESGSQLIGTNVRMLSNGMTCFQNLIANVTNEIYRLYGWTYGVFHFSARINRGLAFPCDLGSTRVCLS